MEVDEAIAPVALRVEIHGQIEEIEPRRSPKHKDFSFKTMKTVDFEAFSAVSGDFGLYEWRAVEAGNHDLAQELLTSHG